LHNTAPQSTNSTNTTRFNTLDKQTSNKVLNSESSTEEQREQAKKSAAWADARIAARNKAENTED
ncbi:hypothetical protein, partial [Klebsiella pneumoniae]|uniref:hypothetical protein n=1 Tax=Klebsiella pneumoniae TaxID=573 RepID=UPI001C6A068D